MNKIQRARWEAAKKLVGRLKDATRLNSASIWYDDMFIDSSQIVVTDTEIYVQCDKCIFGVFDVDTSLDHGMHTTIADFNKWFKSSFKIMKEVKW